MERARPADAVEAPPWKPADGAPPSVHSYEPGARPLLDVRLEAEWRRCPVRARYDWPSGRISYQVEITLAPGGLPETFIRSYWWDEATMRPVQA